MNQDNVIVPTSWGNPLEDLETISIEEYLNFYKTRIRHESEKLFVSEFLYPLLGPKKIKYVVPQYPFLDSEGSTRLIDFAIRYENQNIALEVNGETYHAEGIILNENFDTNLNRQNEILNAGWYLLRFSYSQLLSTEWRKRVKDNLFYLLRKKVPSLISEKVINPNYLQLEVLQSLDYYRKKGWKKGIVILPTGTGKTFLSAFDTLKVNGRILFVVHRIDILKQAKEAFEKIYPSDIIGELIGDSKENVKSSKILFASKDSLRNPDNLKLFKPNEFDYIIIDEVHHGQAPSYKIVLEYFEANFFMLGLTATPDRMDRKDIFELFDYQKVFEYSLDEAIENGFLVPYTYYGLKDNIDYNNIRYNGIKYNINDLNRELIIPKRNEKILEEYLKKGLSNKAVGFCCSIDHAKDMASFFTKNGIPAFAITSETPNREQLIQNFRDNHFTVAFTVDLFNEGIDFPDLRVLLFLRPTESKTVFFQQMGRGLRLCGSKERVIIIDFIGNYKKANNIRKFLAKKGVEKKNPKTGRIEKVLYEFTPNCEVIFDSEVEVILDNQDKLDREITKEDLIDAYYKLAEKLNKKPTQEDINNEGEFRLSKYLTIFKSWSNFLKEIGELTEFSYHFPQGTHMGHILYVLRAVGSNKLEETRLKSKNVRFEGSYDAGEAGNFQRKIKYMLQAAMELGLLIDFRVKVSKSIFQLAFTSNGIKVYNILKPLLENIDLGFKTNDEYSWSMTCEEWINNEIRNFLFKDINKLNLVRNIFLNMDAVNLLLNYLYSIQRKSPITKSEIYGDFFEAPSVRAYLDRHGLHKPTDAVIIRRIPFLFNILETLGIIRQTKSEINVLSFIPIMQIMRLNPLEDNSIILERISKLNNYTRTGTNSFTSEEVSLLKEKFGKSFLTDKYFLPIEENIL